MVNAVIMASGFAKRMGDNKLLLPYKNKPIIQYVIEAALKSKLKEIILVARENEVLRLGEKARIKTVINHNAHKGQSEAVKLGIKNLNPEDGYMFLTGDQPFINSEIINTLIKEFEKYSNHIIVPLRQGKRGSPVIFPKNLAQELLALEGDTGGREIIKNHEDIVSFVNISNPWLLTDIDTYEEYNKLIEGNLTIGDDINEE